VIVSSLWFLGTTFFARYNTAQDTAREDTFFERLNSPVISKPEETRVMDRAQLRTLGVIGIPYGSFVMLLAAIPNPLSGRLSFLVSGGIIAGIGAILFRASQRIQLPAQVEARPVPAVPAEASAKP